MHCANVLCMSRFLSATSCMLLALFATSAYAQRGSNPSRDAMRNLQFKDMDRMLQYKLLPPTHQDLAARTAILKQIGEDFHELQTLNNRMMSVAWSQPTLDYTFVSDMISRIRGRASRLKENLNLPEPVNSEKHAKTTIGSEKEFRDSLLLLDRTIMSFVSNPLFQQANTIELQQGVNARRDLESVLTLSTDLKKSASRFLKEVRNP